MIVTHMTLHGAVSGRTTVLATVVIINDGTGTGDAGNYTWRVEGRNRRRIKSGRLENWPRKRKSAGQLLAKVMSLAYPKDTK